MSIANPPENMPRISPYLYYQDVAGALSWLTRAFGLRERMRMPGPDGRIAHAEMEFADGVVMMGRPGSDYRNPKQLGQVTQSLYLYVDEVDKHFRRAVEAGATVVQEPTDQFYGDRNYAVDDPEGHRWYFAEHVREMTPEDMKAAMKSS